MTKYSTDSFYRSGFRINPNFQLIPNLNSVDLIKTPILPKKSTFLSKRRLINTNYNRWISEQLCMLGYRVSEKQSKKGIEAMMKLCDGWVSSYEIEDHSDRVVALFSSQNQAELAKLFLVFNGFKENKFYITLL